MEFYAHSTERGEYQQLRDHLLGVAELSRAFADSFGAGHFGYVAGLLHDLGKYSKEFQQRIRGNRDRVDHSTAGAQWITSKEAVLQLFGNRPFGAFFARALAYVIAGHHGGLKNFGSIDEEGTLQYRLSIAAVKDYSQAWNEIQVPNEPIASPHIFSPLRLTKDNAAWKYSFFVRMLYSALVDADTIDTRNFCEATSGRTSGGSEYPSIPQLLERFDMYRQQAFQHADYSPVNQIREQIRQTCERQAARPRNMFSLSVPTGGGKTLSSLSFALRHSVHNKLTRIIYVIPFTSIIEQNAKIFRAAVGEDAVLEHHSNILYEEDDENLSLAYSRRLKLSTENWDAPVIVTTSVQFFESLFANGRSKCRKLHHIANSVIIVDEAQNIPRDYLLPSLQALQELVDSYGCSVVLCSATQPVWRELGIQATEIMDSPAPEQLWDHLKRVDVSVQGNFSQLVTDAQLVDWIAASDQILCIVNTRKHAKLLHDMLRDQSVDGLYHLSGRMCAKHRTKILDEIRTRLRRKLPCRVISTQLIEAGVDVDFPKVLRSLAGMDSIAQAAGRCNREGKLKRGEVVVFYPERHGLPSKGWMKETAIEAHHELAVQPDPFSLDCVRNYFERIHGIRGNNKEQVTDAKQILKLIRAKTNFEIPFEDIAEHFTFIEENTRAVVIPWDASAERWIEDAATSTYPLRAIRKLQPYVVQLYEHEIIALQKQQAIRNVNGMLCLTEKSYYTEETGLLTAEENPETEVLIF
jgi:CRISPR-associated helicase Cas3/CRISPR-associated endonuclease Cas3-HD